MDNKLIYSNKLINNEKLQFSITLKEYSSSINETISRINNSSYIRNFNSILKQQPEISTSFENPNLRTRLLNLLVILQNLKNFTQQTLHHTVYLFDIYCSKRILYEKHYTLLFLTCLLVSCKYNDKKNRIPEISELVRLSNEDNFIKFEEDSLNINEEIDKSMFQQMEKHLLLTIDWDLSFWSIEDGLQCICTFMKSILNEDFKNTGDSLKSKNVNKILLLTYQISSFLGEISHTLQDFIQIPSDTIAYVSSLLSISIININNITDQNYCKVMIDLLMDADNVEDFPIKRMYTNNQDTVLKCLHLFMNILFDMNTVDNSYDNDLNDKVNRKYAIFLQKYSQIQIIEKIEVFKQFNKTAFYKLIYLTNLDSNVDDIDEDLVKDQIIHVSQFLLGLSV